MRKDFERDITHFLLKAAAGLGGRREFVRSVATKGFGALAAMSLVNRPLFAFCPQVHSGQGECIPPYEYSDCRTKTNDGCPADDVCCDEYNESPCPPESSYVIPDAFPPCEDCPDDYTVVVGCSNLMGGPVRCYCEYDISECGCA